MEMDDASDDNKASQDDNDDDVHGSTASMSITSEEERLRLSRRTGTARKSYAESDSEDDDEESEESVPKRTQPRRSSPAKASNKRAKKGEDVVYPVGTKVYKNFPGHGYFWGEIKESEPDAHGCFYKVKYSDGDTEEITSEPDSADLLEELRKAVAAAAAHERLSHPVEKTAPPSPSMRQKSIEECFGKKQEKKKKAPLVASKPKKKQRVDDSESEFERDEIEKESESEPEEFVEDSDDEETVRRPKKRAATTAAKKKAVSSKPSEEEDEEENEESDVEFDDAILEDGDDGAYQRLLKSIQKNSSKTKASKSTSCKVKGSDHYDVSSILKRPYSGGDNLPVITEPQRMFDDMIQNKLTDNGSKASVLMPLLKTLKNRALRVATMCSGTESPVLALDMLQKSLREFCPAHLSDELKKEAIDVDRILEIEHVFSCEIEPFKQ
jgi:hypothetical protein